MVSWGLSMMFSLKQTFNKTLFKLKFAFDQKEFVWKREVLSEIGVIPNWAIDQDVLVPKLEEILPLGRITAMNAAALMCAVSIKHKHSRYNPVSFFENFIKLYNAKNKDEIYAFEHIEPFSEEWKNAERVYNNAMVASDGDVSKGLEKLKIHCWALDLASATDGTFLGRAWGHHKCIDVDKVKQIVCMYQSSKDENVGLLEPDGSHTLSAFPKNEYLEDLKRLSAARKISETQCGIILCFILHSQEKRRDGSSYITHPMGVADLVRQHGEKYLDGNKDQVWRAMVAALLHDGGEKSNINLETDLAGLLPDDVIEAIKCLHKSNDDTYFEYIERIANNPLAATVKLSDLYHNSLDNDDPSIKQTYTYPIAAAYLEYRLGNPSEKLTVMDFVAQKGVCTIKQFGDIIEATDIYRKDPLEKNQDRLGIISNVKPLKDYFKEEKLPDYAHSRRKENTPLYP